jgi:hypothetical protein
MCEVYILDKTFIRDASEGRDDDSDLDYATFGREEQ